MHDYDVITRRAVFRNVDTRPCSCNDVNVCNVTSPLGNSKVVQKASSATVDFEATARRARPMALLVTTLTTFLTTFFD